MSRRERQPDIADLIARDIQSGVLAPGTWLRQVELETRYGRPRLEVRRALDRLAQKRLVQHLPNRGFHVFEPDGREATEVRDIRVILESSVAEAAVRHATAEGLVALRARARRFTDLVPTGTVLDQYDANLSFHAALLDLGGTGELVRLVAELRGRTSSAPAGQWRTKARVEQSAAEHHAMVDALEARDAEVLKGLIARHILQLAKAP